MSTKDLHNRLIQKYGPVIDLRENPGFVEEVYQELSIAPQVGPSSSGGSVEPFGVSWMDSWVAHWIYNEKLNVTKTRDQQVAAALQSLVDLKFNERLGEIQRYISRLQRVTEEPPDGGPPEPGTPPAGPERFFSGESRLLRDEPPDAGPPEPGTPPAGPARRIFGTTSRFLRDEPPDAGPPEPGTPPAGPERLFARDAPPDGGTPPPGVPLPPEPGVPPGPEPPGPVPPSPVPPTGPDPARFGENPWILYWFLSIKAPMLLDVIDAHITRRINALTGAER